MALPIDLTALWPSCAASSLRPLQPHTSVPNSQGVRAASSPVRFLSPVFLCLDAWLWKPTSSCSLHKILLTCPFLFNVPPSDHPHHGELLPPPATASGRLTGHSRGHHRVPTRWHVRGSTLQSHGTSANPSLGHRFSGFTSASPGLAQHQHVILVEPT